MKTHFDYFRLALEEGAFKTNSDLDIFLRKISEVAIYRRARINATEIDNYVDFQGKVGEESSYLRGLEHYLALQQAGNDETVICLEDDDSVSYVFGVTDLNTRNLTSFYFVNFQQNNKDKGSFKFGIINTLFYGGRQIECDSEVTNLIVGEVKHGKYEPLELGPQQEEEIGMELSNSLVIAINQLEVKKSDVTPTNQRLN